MPKEKTYKAIWLTEELATRVKILATKRKQSIIAFIEELVNLVK